MFSVICMQQGSESNAISILCMYCSCGRIDNKADFDFFFYFDIYIHIYTLHSFLLKNNSEQWFVNVDA